MNPNTMVRVHAEWYPLSALDDAAIRFESFCSVEKTLAGSNEIDLVFSFRDDAPQETVDEFLNVALLSAIESFAAHS